MKLLTHNMLMCTVKGVKNGYPLKIETQRVEQQEAEFNPEFLRHMFPKLDWPALRAAAIAMGYSDLPETVEPTMLDDNENFLRKFHHALLELDLEEGALICPETGRRFPVSKGIPNMLLNEDEV